MVDGFFEDFVVLTYFFSAKLKMLGDILKTIKDTQLIPFHYSECLYLKDYLNGAVVLDQEQLYSLSLRLYSPKGARSPRHTTTLT